MEEHVVIILIGLGTARGGVGSEIGRSRSVGTGARTTSGLGGWI